MNDYQKTTNKSKNLIFTNPKTKFITHNLREHNVGLVTKKYLCTNIISSSFFFIRNILENIFNFNKINQLSISGNTKLTTYKLTSSIQNYKRSFHFMIKIR